MDINPINYELVFEPDFKKFTFSGKETITIDCKKTTKIISINCAEIKIESCQVKNKGKLISSIPKTNEKKEELQIHLKEKISGSAKVTLEFQGILNDRLLGFYRSQYKQGGKTKYRATTHF